VERLTPELVADLQDSLLGWAAPRLRELPWRATRDPWPVLVSEFMLQQTGVARVLPKWSAFVAEYPTPADCASASLGDLLRLWQGLGYPRRARNLHASASAIVTRHGGVVPDDLESLLALPGVGPYTARAVLAFAFELDVAVVDTNIARVLARFTGRRLKPREVQSLADDFVAEGASWLWNQGFMDLGATVCRPDPACDECPWSVECAWRGEGDDPSVGSAGVSVAQSRFEGSDRQARGRLIKALGAGTVKVGDIARIMDRSPEVAARLLVDLENDGLVVHHRESGLASLP